MEAQENIRKVDNAVYLRCASRRDDIIIARRLIHPERGQVKGRYENQIKIELQ